MDDDTLLSYGAIAIEGLILMALVSLCIRSEKLRKHTIVVLGSITPILLFYLGAWIDFAHDPTDPSARFAFYAMWIMGFGFFFICAIVGSLIALLPRPTNLWLRFLLGAISGWVL